MSQATIAPHEIKTLAELRRRLGGIPLDRIWFHPAPGTAAEKDVVEAEDRENRLCELVDGTLVEKAMGFEEARLAARLIYLVNSSLRPVRPRPPAAAGMIARFLGHHDNDQTGPGDDPRPVL
jgi:hypothetical protein